MRFAQPLAAVLVAAALPALAVASPLQARVSTSGLNFLRDRALEMVPSRIAVPPMKVDMFSCSPENAYFELSDAQVNLTVSALSLTLPSPGTIRADVTLTVAASGKAHFEHIWACYGRETCDASIGVRNARAIIDLSPSIDAQGKPKIALSKIDVQLAPSDVNFALSNCPEDDVVNLVVGFVKDFGLQLGIVIGQEIAKKQVGPALEGLLAGFLSYEGNGGMFSPDVHFIDFKAALTGVDINTSGLTVSGDLDLSTKYPAAACVSNDPGDPAVFAGPAPDLGAGAASDVAIAVNLGLIQDVLYHAWHEGLMCVTPDTLKQFGLELDALDHIGDLLPGFPAGTHFTFEAQVAEPPRVEGNVATSAKLGVHVNRMMAKLIATMPDKTTRILRLDLDATASATMVMDPRINALALQVDGVKLDRMDVDDQLGLEAIGFDFARIRQLVETIVLPRMLGQLGAIPVTGPVFGGFGGLPIYVILKELKTTPAYVAVKANLFKAPDNDREAPTTQIIDKPSKVVKPADAVLMFGGSDKQVPTELLRYRVVVDGMAQGEPTFVKVLKVGEDGKSAKVRVEVHAVDLAGNEDRAGQVAEIDVDGVLPQLNLTAQLRGAVDDLTPSLTWVASDDRTAAAKMRPRVEVTELPAQAGKGAEVEVYAKDLPAGSTETTLEGLSAGKQYRVVLSVSDEAGNQAATTLIFSVSPDAAGGCAVGAGGRDGLAGLLLVGLALAVVTRRRRQRGV